MPIHEILYPQAHPQAAAGAPSTSAPITVDTSSPPLNYSYHPGGPGGQQQINLQQPQQQLASVQQPPQPQQAAQASSANGTAQQGSASGGGGRRGPGSIKWTKEGVSTSAERRLPFVHRFRPVDLPPPAGLGTIHILHQHFYSTKLNLTSKFFIKLGFSVKSKQFPFQHYILTKVSFCSKYISSIWRIFCKQCCLSE